MTPSGMAREHKLLAVEAPAPISADEVPAFVDALYQAFHSAGHPEDIANVAKVLEPERSLAVRDGGRIVGTASVYSRRLTVPGAVVPAAAVTMVGVRASHRRRGLLTALMRRQLDDVREAGEPVAALWASETIIYGRFGYGMATRGAELTVDTRAARLREPPAPRAVLAEPSEAIEQMAAIHDAVRPGRPGMLDRAGSWWEFCTRDPEHQRDGASELHAAVIEGSAYALYAVKQIWRDGRAQSRVIVREVVAATPEGNAEIWAYLLGLDLTSELQYDGAAPDDPLPHMVTEAQTVRMRLREALWLRVVDVPQALAARTYAVPFEVVLEVADAFCPWNAGRWALRWDGETATCARTSLPASLELSAVDLGAAYLGGTPLDVLARAGRVRELRAGALARASLAFRGEREPWCPETF
jgi:predicted acetyltransferase